MLSYIFITTPLQKVLGPRYSEFDVFGVIAVTFFSTLIAWVGATVAAAVSHERLRSTFGTRNLFVLVVAPALVLLVLTFGISGEFAWLGLIHVSSCSGILAGAGSSLLFDRTANEETKQRTDDNGNRARPLRWTESDMARESEPMPDRPVRELNLQRPAKRTKVSLILLIGAAVIALLDLVGPCLLSGGHQIISDRLHDQLAVLALLSVPLILALLAIGAFLGMLDWYAARKASLRPSGMTVVATCLNVVFIVIAIVIVGGFLWTFDPMPPT